MIACNFTHSSPPSWPELFFFTASSTRAHSLLPAHRRLHTPLSIHSKLVRELFFPVEAEKSIIVGLLGWRWVNVLGFGEDCEFSTHHHRNFSRPGGWYAALKGIHRNCRLGRRLWKKAYHCFHNINRLTFIIRNPETRELENFGTLVVAQFEF